MIKSGNIPFRDAIITGNLNFVKSQIIHYNRQSQYFAIYYERLEIFDYFMTIKPYDKIAMQAAVEKLSTKMVDYLILNNYSTDKMAALRIGSTESVDYLIDSITGDDAASVGRIDVLEKFDLECTSASITLAVRFEDLDTIKYILYTGVEPKEDALFEAIKLDNLEIFKYLYSIIEEDVTDLAAEYGAIRILEYLFSINAPYSDDIINIAIDNYNLDCIKFLKGKVETDENTILLLKDSSPRIQKLMQ